MNNTLAADPMITIADDILAIGLSMIKQGKGTSFKPCEFIPRVSYAQLLDLPQSRGLHAGQHITHSDNIQDWLLLLTLAICKLSLE